MNKRIQDLIVEYGERYNIPFSALEKFATDILSVRPTPKVLTDEGLQTILEKIAQAFRKVPLDKVNPAAVQEWVAIARNVRDAMKKGEVR